MHFLRRWLGIYLWIAVAFTTGAPVFADEVVTPTFESLLSELNQQSFSKKSEVINRLESTGDERAVPALKAMLEGDLYVSEANQRVLIVHSSDSGYATLDAANGEIGTDIPKNELKKIRVNNRLRRQLKRSIARLSLGSKNPDVRLAAVKELAGGTDEETLDLLRQALAKEKAAKVAHAIKVALAMSSINNPDAGKRLEAIGTLAGDVNPEVRNLLQGVADSDADPKVGAAARNALKQIDRKLSLYNAIETVFFGLSLGSVLLLAAIGLAITFGVMKVINMAHGELIMLGAYTTYMVQQALPNHIGVSLFIAIPAAFVVSALFGILIERGVIRFLYGRPLETLLATFGISLILQQMVRSIFSPLNRSVETPAWMSGSWQINDALSLTYNRLYIVIFALIVFFALMLILKKTSLGLQVRAVSQNRDMAKAMGIRSDWVDAMTFGLGSGIAGVAGVALSQLTNVGPNLGQSYIIDSFMVVVFGGVGNLWGTLVAGMSLGIFNKFLEPYSGAVLAKILVLVFIILFIQKKPRGLFPQKGRAAED